MAMKTICMERRYNNKDGRATLRETRRDCLHAGTTWSAGESSHRRDAARNCKECLHNADAKPYSKCSINLYRMIPSWILILRRMHHLINAAAAAKGAEERRRRRWREQHTFRIPATFASPPAAAIFNATLVSPSINATNYDVS
jgi:hypothetical protein